MRCWGGGVPRIELVMDSLTHLSKILYDAPPYHQVNRELQLYSAIPAGPPYIWFNSGGFVQCIASCFEKDPERRPSSAELDVYLE